MDISQQLLEQKSNEAVAFLQPYLHIRSTDDRDALSLALKPDEEDFDRAFLPEYAKMAKEGYQALWDTKPVPTPNLGQSQLRLVCAPAMALLVDSPLFRFFPGGYRNIAPLLQPESWWAVFKFTEPGKTSGMAYDGLVHMGGQRWVWFPKPWRVLN
ncbi:MAG: hypothetical protein HN348_20645 [Proteobacteria bacterium]|jgi:hypothetical protein|nr:hypothetical protein [Pseudomonadota bacterium]